MVEQLNSVPPQVAQKKSLTIFDYARLAIDTVVSLPVSAIVYTKFEPPITFGLGGILRALRTASKPLERGEYDITPVGFPTKVRVVVFPDRDGENVANVYVDTPDNYESMAVRRGSNMTEVDQLPPTRVDSRSPPSFFLNTRRPGKDGKLKRYTHAIISFKPDEKRKKKKK